MIYSLSAETAEVSSETSGRIVRVICKYVEKDFENLSAEEQFVIIERYQFFIRKTAHFTAYTILAMFIGNAISMHIDKISLRLGIAFAGGVLYSVSDEIHQKFVPGRSCELRDVMIDSAGAILGCIFLFILFKIFQKKKRSI